MESIVREIKARIPANKFYPPRLDASRYLHRPRLTGVLDTTRLVIIEAQAGQGKSVLAAQLVTDSGKPFAWYQLGQEDADPVAFQMGLVCCLIDALPQWRSPLIEKLLKSGEIATIETQQCANVLLNELDATFQEDFVLVFDDFHLISETSRTRDFLDYLMATAPPRLQIVCTSRVPVLPGESAGKYRRQARILDNAELAMTEEEVGSLFSEVLGVDIPGHRTRELYRVTEGWVMGLILGSHAFLRQQDGDEIYALADSRIRGSLQGLVEYFQDEVFNRLPMPLRRSLAKLSLVEVIPLELAEILAEVPEIGRVLVDLMVHNLFVRSLDGADTVFGLHHLFRDFLQAVAAELFDADERRSICRQIADYYRQIDELDEAVVFSLEAGDVAAATHLLPKVGMELFSSNRLVSLDRLLGRFPSETMDGDGWCAFFAGAVGTETNPPEAGPHLETALEVFSQAGEEVGELLALVYLIYYRMGYDGRYGEGARLLPRAEELFRRLSEHLDLPGKILSAQHLANGFCFFEGDLEKAETYSGMALQLAQQHGLDNLQAGVRGVRGFLYLLCGEWEQCRREIEMTGPLLLEPQISGINRLANLTLRINLLEMHADTENFALHELCLLEGVEDNLVAKSIVGPFLLVWKSQLALAAGDFSEACRCVDTGLRQSDSALTPHLRSEFLQSRALALACLGEEPEAVSAAQESLRLRGQAGGAYYGAWNDVMLGAGYAHLGHGEEAESLLNRAVERARCANSSYLLCAALLQRAFCLLTVLGEDDALTDLEAGLERMRQRGFPHVYGMVPSAWRRLLALAVRHGIEVDFAGKLARTRLGAAFAEDGRLIPLLNINVLGNCALFFAEGGALAPESLTQAQRQLLVLILCSRRLQVTQEEVMCALWPDSSPSKARSSFDSLLLRLRKSLSVIVGDGSVGDYLVFRKGLLSLHNCEIDARVFSEFAERGLSFARKKCFWQAGNAFYAAIRRFEGPFAGAVYGGDEARDYSEDLLRTYVGVCGHWSRMLISVGQHEEAVEVLNQALKFDRTNDELVRKLYRLHMQRGNKGKARAVLHKYRQSLAGEEFEAGEIEDILQAVTGSPT